MVDIPLFPAALVERLNAQSYPPSTLYVVATPIGNLGDISLRAQVVLQRVDAIAAEDTRHSAGLLAALGLSKPLVALHRHNEQAASIKLIARLQQGERIALISDAGTPCISDPGARLVRAVTATGLRVMPIPGASSVLTALMASGVTDDLQPGYVFAGFVPAKAGTRRTWLTPWVNSHLPVVMFETAQRIEDTLATLHELCSAVDAAIKEAKERHITIARELTKQFEELVTLPLSQAQTWLQAAERRCQGEFVLILQAAPVVSTAVSQAFVDVENLLRVLLRHTTLKDSVAQAVELTGRPRSALYALALTLREEGSREDSSHREPD